MNKLQTYGALALKGGLALLVLIILPLALALEFVPERGVIGALSVERLVVRLQDRGVNFDFSAGNLAPIPRVFTAHIPADWRFLKPPARQKKIFLAVMLPLVLRENERILENRERLNTLLVDDQRSPRDNRWLRVLTVDYGVKPDDWTALLDRMDAVPPALGLAQAAIESGWGGSRFAAEGNALFGQWTQVSGQGIVPERRAATSRHEVRKFRNIGASVSAYLRNLNTHMAYTDFRSLRSKIRSEGGAITGQEAAGTLIHYAETGSDYVALLSEVMVTNELGRFDPAKLTPQKGACK